MLLNVEHLYKYFNGQALLKDINFTVEDREAVGLIGINGCGKSTLLNIITGSEGYDKTPEGLGSVNIAGKASIGFLRQNSGLNSELTIGEEMKNAFAPLLETLDKMKVLEKKMADGGKHLGTFSYHKKPEWMIFKPETFKLSRKLKGIETLCILTEDGFQVGGFNFEKVSREFAVNNAADADNIYGDKFTKGEKCVTEIGNNVMLDFGEFDFSEKQPSRLVISGKSPLALNSIHLILNGSEGENRILCEFRTDDSENYAQMMRRVSLISSAV